MLRTRRAELQVNQKVAAEQVGVTQATWSRWETGDDLPRSDKIGALAAWLGKDPAEVLTALYAGSQTSDLEARLMQQVEELSIEVARLRDLVEPPPEGA